MATRTTERQNAELKMYGIYPPHIPETHRKSELLLTFIREGNMAGPARDAQGRANHYLEIREKLIGVEVREVRGVKPIGVVKDIWPMTKEQVNLSYRYSVIYRRRKNMTQDKIAKMLSGWCCFKADVRTDEGKIRSMPISLIERMLR